MEKMKALDEAVALSVGDMAFMDAEPIEKSKAAVPAGQLVHIRFAHPLVGYITLHLPSTTKQRLVENVFGRSWDELAGSEVDDCLMEMVNIIAGNFLLKIGEGEHSHAVSLPQMLYDEQDIPPIGKPLTRHYNIDDDVVRVTLAYIS